MYKNYLLVLLLSTLVVINPAQSYAQTSASTQTPPNLTPEDTGSLPESYYNSLKNLDLNESTSSDSVMVSQNTATTSTTQTTPTSPTNPTTQTTPTTPTAPTTPTTPKSKKSDKPYTDAKFNVIQTQLGALQKELDDLKKADEEGKNAGYNSGFYIKSSDDLFKLRIVLRMQGRYSLNIIEDGEDAHSFVLRRGFIFFRGNAFTKNLEYAFLVAPHAAPPLFWWNVSYRFNDAITIGMNFDTIYINPEASDSSASLMFISKSLAGLRFNLGDSLGIYGYGGIGKFSYFLGIWNGPYSDLETNANTELVYSGRFEYAILNKLSSGQSDVAYTEKPALGAGLGLAYGHYEDGDQARVILGEADVNFKYKGLSMRVAMMYRQTDPNQFTQAQTDLGITAYSGYFIIPKKLEFGLRLSALIDDITDAGVNLRMKRGNFTGLGGDFAGVDIGGDSDNEWEYSAVLGYYFSGYNLKVQGQYTLLVDGIQGPDDLVNHIGMVQFQVQF